MSVLTFGNVNINLTSSEWSLERTLILYIFLFSNRCYTGYNNNLNVLEGKDMLHVLAIVEMFLVQVIP